MSRKRSSNCFIGVLLVNARERGQRSVPCVSQSPACGSGAGDGMINAPKRAGVTNNYGIKAPVPPWDIGARAALQTQQMNLIPRRGAIDLDSLGIQLRQHQAIKGFAHLPMEMWRRTLAQVHLA